LGGTLRQVLAVKANIDFANTAYVDLGTLNWSYNSGGAFFYAQLIGIKQISADSVVPKFLCTKYATDCYNDFANGIVSQNANSDLVRIMDTAYTDATAFKAAMAGVLLAYEKAS
jgi:hypothetical protein